MYRIWSAFALALLLAGCGGGGESKSTANRVHIPPPSAAVTDDAHCAQAEALPDAPVTFRRLGSQCVRSAAAFKDADGRRFPLAVDPGICTTLASTPLA